jgi:hypothetical protein
MARIDDRGIGLDPRTTGQGLIDSITGKPALDGSHMIQIQGWLGPKLPDRAGLEDALPARAGFDRTHLWPRGFGEEAAAGMTYASPNFNRSWALTVENTIANVYASAAPGDRVHLSVTAITTPEDPNVLDHVVYRVMEVEGTGSGYRAVEGFTVTIDSKGLASDAHWIDGNHEHFYPESNQSLASEVGPETVVGVGLGLAAVAAAAATEAAGIGVRVVTEHVEGAASKIETAAEELAPKIRVDIGHVEGAISKIETAAEDEAEELIHQAAHKGKHFLSELGGLIGGGGNGDQPHATVAPNQAGAPGGTPSDNAQPNAQNPPQDATAPNPTVNAQDPPHTTSDDATLHIHTVTVEDHPQAGPADGRDKEGEHGEHSDEGSHDGRQSQGETSAAPAHPRAEHQDLQPDLNAPGTQGVSGQHLYAPDQTQQTPGTAQHGHDQGQQTHHSGLPTHHDLNPSLNDAGPAHQVDDHSARANDAHTYDPSHTASAAPAHPAGQTEHANQTPNDQAAQAAIEHAAAVTAAAHAAAEAASQVQL